MIILDNTTSTTTTTTSTLTTTTLHTITTTTTTTTTTTSTTTTTCLAGCGSWTEEGSKCYEVFTDKLSFNKAQASCGGYGGNLAHIESQTEQDAVFGLITGDTWIGGSDKDKHKKWVWYNGAKINRNFYRNWKKNWKNWKKNYELWQWEMG